MGLGTSLWSAGEAYRLNAEFHQWSEARPMETTIDLSRTGEKTVPFHQTCSTSHGESLYLSCDLDNESKRNAAALLAPLSGKIGIKDSKGNEVESAEINKQTVQYWGGQIVLTRFARFPRGDYQAKIRVDAGVAALVGKEQTIYATYHLCGVEQLPALIAGAFAIGAGLIGLVASICVWPGLVENGIWRSS